MASEDDRDRILSNIAIGLLDYAVEKMLKDDRLQQFINKAKQDGRDDITPEELEQFVVERNEGWQSHLELVAQAESMEPDETLDPSSQ